MDFSHGAGSGLLARHGPRLGPVKQPTPRRRPVMIHANIDDPVDELDDVAPRDAGPADGDAASVADRDEPASKNAVAESLPSDAVSEGETANTRPCAYCGRPVPQRSSAGRPFRYCRDNDNACLRAARNARMRYRNAPGLAGQVAQAFEIVDRLDRAVETLTEALHTELSPAGVERRLMAMRAETATRLSAVLAERDEARREAEQQHAFAVRAAEELARVREESAAAVAAAEAEAQAARDAAAEAATRADELVAAAQDEAASAVREAAEAREHARAAELERDEARSAAATAEAQRDEAMRELAAARDDAAEARRERDAAQQELETAQQELETSKRELDAAKRELDAARTEARHQAAAAQQAAERAEAAAAELDQVRSAAEREVAAARQAVASAEERSRHIEEELRAAQARISDLTARIAATEADRDAARQEAAAAHAHASQLAEQVGQLAAALARLTPAPEGQRHQSSEPAGQRPAPAATPPRKASRKAR